MPRNPGDPPDRDPMAGEVERLLRQLGPTAQDSVTPKKPAPPRPRPRLPEPPARIATLPTPLGVWGRNALVAVLSVAMTLWPYRVCGLPLIGYFTAVAGTLVAGGWAAWASWRRRMGLAHVVAVALVFTAVALGALQVLPRLGYAPVTVPWGCSP